jgi:hypothetical protein
MSLTGRELNVINENNEVGEEYGSKSINKPNKLPKNDRLLLSNSLINNQINLISKKNLKKSFVLAELIFKRKF